MSDEDKLLISKCALQLYQESDSCQINDKDQYLTLEIEDAGGGPYLIIKTNRWAIDADMIPKFSKMLQEFMKYVEKTEKEL